MANPVFYYALGSVIAVSLLSLLGLLAFRVKEEKLNRAIFYLIALSVGALFGDAAIHLLPEAYGSGVHPALIGTALLVGIFLFFILEKYFHWMHRHDVEVAAHHCEHQHIEPLGYLSLASDAVHNFTDGLIIAAGYWAGIEVGLATTVAIILHEIPHEIGNFGLLLHAGFSRARAIFYNFLSGLFAILGTVLALSLGPSTEAFLVYILPLAAGGFLYIAGSDLVPELHKTTELKKSLIQLGFIALGVALMYLLLLVG